MSTNTKKEIFIVQESFDLHLMKPKVFTDKAAAEKEYLRDVRECHGPCYDEFCAYNNLPKESFSSALAYMNSYVEQNDDPHVSDILDPDDEDNPDARQLLLHLLTADLDMEDEGKASAMLAALQQIALDIDCQGPGCQWCAIGEHPPTNAARIAQQTLKNLGLEE